MGLAVSDIKIVLPHLEKDIFEKGVLNAGVKKAFFTDLIFQFMHCTFRDFIFIDLESLLFLFCTLDYL